MPDKTDTEHGTRNMEDGTRNDNMQILFSPGCDQPLRDNKNKSFNLIYIDSNKRMTK